MKETSENDRAQSLTPALTNSSVESDDAAAPCIEGFVAAKDFIRPFPHMLMWVLRCWAGVALIACVIWMNGVDFQDILLVAIGFGLLLTFFVATLSWSGALSDATYQVRVRLLCDSIEVTESRIQMVSRKDDVQEYAYSDIVAFPGQLRHGNLFNRFGQEDSALVFSWEPHDFGDQVAIPDAAWNSEEVLSWLSTRSCQLQPGIKEHNRWISLGFVVLGMLVGILVVSFIGWTCGRFGLVEKCFYIWYAVFPMIMAVWGNFLCRSYSGEIVYPAIWTRLLMFSAKLSAYGVVGMLIDFNAANAVGLWIPHALVISVFAVFLFIVHSVISKEHDRDADFQKSESE